MQTHKLRLALIGSGGDGVMSAATMILQTAAAQGLYGMMTQSYGPQIRGGESAAYLNISDQPVLTENIEKDVVVCFRFSDTYRFRSEMNFSPTGLLIHEAADESAIPEWLNTPKITIAPIPFQSLLEKEGLPELSKNVLLFGIVCHTLGWDIKKAEAHVAQKFSHKSKDVIEGNLKALHLGAEHVGQIKIPFQCKFTTRPSLKLETTTGNQACAEAATRAGCRFYAGYPITPSSEILETMLEIQPPVGGTVIQAEDEIASMGMIVGASYGGVPSMTATSGPGLSLMTEMMGLASKAEIPLVMVDCQRAGPATGMPSRTEQSDLFHAVYGGHGDFPRVVLAPTDVADCWPLMFDAFYLAEKYQLPVIVLSDAYIAQRAENILAPNITTLRKPQRAKATPLSEGETYRRFDCCDEDLPEGVSAMALPGTPGAGHTIAGIEQNASGIPSSLRTDHVMMNQKRFAKLKSIAQETSGWYELIGKSQASVGIIAWGSLKGAIQEYVERHPETKAFIPKILHPFPVQACQLFLGSVQILYFAELNFQGQLHQVVKSHLTLPPHTTALNLSGGTPVSSFELEQKIHKEIR